MTITIKDVIKLAKDLPEDKLADAYEKLAELKEDGGAGGSKGENAPVCRVSCGSDHL